jgi:hypothetical protein
MNSSWFIAGLLGKELSFQRCVMRFVPYLMGICLMICFALWVAPTMKITLALSIPADGQCPNPGAYYRQIGAVTDSWYDFMFEHVGTCTPCSFPISSSLCADFCGSNPASFVSASPSHRMISDVAASHGLTFIVIIIVVVRVIPTTIHSAIAMTMREMKRVPVYGKSIAAKWTNLVKRVTSPWVTVMSPYRHDRTAWVIWCYAERVLLMFVSGVKTLQTFSILSSLINALHFFVMLLMRSHISCINYGYELFTTFLSFIFPIIYQHLPPRDAYGTAFPSAAVAVGVIFMIASFIYEHFLKHESLHGDKSRSRRRKIANGNEDFESRFSDYDVHLHEMDAEAELVTINDIDVRDMEELELNVENNDYGSEINVNRDQLQRLTSHIMEVVSHAHTWRHMGHIALGAWVVLVCLLGSTGWYCGAVIGFHNERLSAQC